MTYPELGVLFKQKNPQWADLSDDEAGRMLVEKYPAYKSMITEDIRVSANPDATTAIQPIDQLPKAEEPSIYEPAAPYNEEEGFSWGKMARNAPGDLGENVLLGGLKGVASLTKPKTYEALARLGMGAQGMAQGRLNPADPNQNLFISLVQQKARDLGTAQGWQEHPISNLTELWALLNPAVQAAAPGTRLAGTMKDLNAFTLTRKASERILGKMGSMAETGGAAVGGVLSGAGAEAIKSGIGATAEESGRLARIKTRWGDIPIPWAVASEGGEVFWRNWRQRDPISSMAEALIEGLSNAKEQRYIQYNKQLGNLKVNRIDGLKGSWEDGLGKIKESLKEWKVTGFPDNSPDPIDVKKLNFKTSPITSPDVENKIREIIQEYQTPQSPEGFDAMTPQQFDMIKKRMWDRRADIPLNQKSARALTADLIGKVRKQIGQDVEGYDKLMKDYQSISDTIDEVERVFSTPQEGVRKLFPKSYGPTINKLTGLLKDAPKGEYQREVLNALNLAMGMPDQALLPAIAGRVLSELVGTGLISRSAFALSIAEIPASVPFALLQLAFVSPKTYGLIAGVLGATKRQKSAINTVFNMVTQKLPPGIWAEGMTLLEVLDRFEQYQENTTPATQRMYYRNP